MAQIAQTHKTYVYFYKSTLGWIPLWVGPECKGYFLDDLYDINKINVISHIPIYIVIR